MPDNKYEALNSAKSLVYKSKTLKNIAHSIITYYEAHNGPIYALRKHKKDLERNSTIHSGIKHLSNRWPYQHENSDESPIFIFSAGWRSGSTLLQRMVMSKEPTLIWGEPYCYGGLINHLAAPLKAITETWPRDDYIISERDIENLSNHFVANLYPTTKNLLEANMAYFSKLFIEPAKELGFNRWGIKEVRLTIDHAYFLKWMFPNAKFLFLYRNPLNSYSSYRIIRDSYDEWPDKPILTPALFAEHWKKLADGYLEGHKDIGGLLIKYEDLCDGKADFSSMEDYLNIEIDRGIMNKKIGSHKVDREKTPSYELKIVRKIVAPTAEKLGYSVWYSS